MSKEQKILEMVPETKNVKKGVGKVIAIVGGALLLLVSGGAALYATIKQNEDDDYDLGDSFNIEEPENEKYVPTEEETTEE